MKKNPMEVEQKDLDRLKSLRAKSRGDRQKGVQYAEAMANAIGDAHKAWRRYKAAVQVYHFDSPVSIPFIKKAMSLGLKEAGEEWGRIEISRKENAGRIALGALGFKYDTDKTYEENLREIIRMDASVWGKVYIPDGMEKSDRYRAHRMLDKLGVWGD
jgi:hypothetical protein